MTAMLEKLVVKGNGKVDAAIDFNEFGNLIRGPSDSGKSHIMDCFLYLLGGDKLPKRFPENSGYDILLLQFVTDSGDRYTIKRAFNGGGASVYSASINDLAAATVDPDTIDINTLLIQISGAAERLLLRSKSKKGPVTSGDLRHWFLVSQTQMISEDLTMGQYVEETQRKAAFCLYLTGKDDSAIVLAASKDEKKEIKTKIQGIESDLKRVNAELPDQSSHDETKKALERVDATFSLLSTEQTERSKQLKNIRENLNRLAVRAKEVNAELIYSSTLISRFNLLADKYKSDYSRLTSINDGIAIIEKLDDFPCPLCNTLVHNQNHNHIDTNSLMVKQRAAVSAEANKIMELNNGLLKTLDIELQRRTKLLSEAEELKNDLKLVEAAEKNALLESNAEFSVDPKTLAIKRSELYSIMKLYEEQERLNAELNRLNNLTPKKAAPVLRDTVIEGHNVAQIALDLIKEWGFPDTNSVELDIDQCDIKINGRPRLSFGAGFRAIFLSAMTVALMKHAMEKKHPHLGLIVLDSPIKSYSDPKNNDVTVSPTVIRDAFYKWLSSWSGPGQIIVLENEPINEDSAAILLPTQFTKSRASGRYGFYPV